MIELENNEILAHEAADRSFCQRAAEAATDSRLTLQLTRVEASLPIGRAATAYVLQGVAKISLQEPGYEHHGITQEQADTFITKHSGDIEYFFYPILVEAERDG